MSPRWRAVPPSSASSTCRTTGRPAVMGPRSGRWGRRARGAYDVARRGRPASFTAPPRRDGQPQEGAHHERPALGEVAVHASVGAHDPPDGHLADAGAAQVDDAGGRREPDLPARVAEPTPSSRCPPSRGRTARPAAADVRDGSAPHQVGGLMAPPDLAARRRGPTRPTRTRRRASVRPVPLAAEEGVGQRRQVAGGGLQRPVLVLEAGDGQRRPLGGGEECRSASTAAGPDPHVGVADQDRRPRRRWPCPGCWRQGSPRLSALATRCAHGAGPAQGRRCRRMSRCRPR